MDLPDAEAAWPDIQAQLQDLGHEPLRISAVTQQGTKELVAETFALLDSLPEMEDHAPDEAEETEGELPVYTLEEDEMAFEVIKLEDGVFQVNGVAIERAAAMTYWDYDDALMRFQRILEATGVSEALINAGVDVGDTVFIGDMELEWSV
jgi:GTP-binding protein